MTEIKNDNRWEPITAVIKDSLDPNYKEPVLVDLTEDQYRQLKRSTSDWYKTCKSIAREEKGMSAKKVEKAYRENLRLEKERLSRRLEVIPPSEVDLRRSIVAEIKSIEEIEDIIKKGKRDSALKVVELVLKFLGIIIPAFGLQILALIWGDKVSGKAADKHVPHA